MCEWLSRWEWCDVKVLCGGRAFSAHRAVLASVSAFLRRILLSCPIDESPTFIVLPDFDTEAMSSVLYYIYNGEVVIKKENLEQFFDIIKTMQIFVDHQNLPIFKNYPENFRPQYSEDGLIANKSIFRLKYENCGDQRYVNIKKGQDVMNILLQCSPSDSAINDKLCQNWSEQRKANLGNLQPSYGDRQRSSFLRDLFIETYPQNGNVNGLTTSVLAISNECYRAPASALLTNANGKNLDEARAERLKKNTGQISSHLPTLYKPGMQHYSIQNNTQKETFAKDLNASEVTEMKLHCRNRQPKSSSLNVRTEQMPFLRMSSLRVGHHEQFPFINFSALQPSVSVSPEVLKSCRPLVNVDGREVYTSNMNKVAILNQVLDNPWNPRMPINYKPFRKKLLDQESSKRDAEQYSFVICNDNNNNIEKIQPVKIEGNNGTAQIHVKERPATSATSHVVERDDYKCTVCNQVYTSSESLALHARRHSTSARYSCSECGKTFSQLRNFKYHVSVHRGTREFAATCSVCGKYFNDRGYLSSHMKIHRNRKEYKCSLCPKSFNQRVAYNMHVRIHTGVKPHVCPECGKAFSRKMLLKQHQRTHSGERPYACPHCDKRFADRSNMTLHLRLHTGIKPFSCTLCPKSFTKKHHLKSHLNFHTGSKPYSCPRCRLAFTQSSNMRTHLKKCTAVGPAADTSPHTQ